MNQWSVFCIFHQKPFYSSNAVVTNCVLYTRRARENGHRRNLEVRGSQFMTREHDDAPAAVPMIIDVMSRPDDADGD